MAHILTATGEPWTGGARAASAGRADPSARGTGVNVPNSLADLDVPFPADWARALRAISPVTTAYSHLRPYWYRAGGRWVLYDCLPVELIDPAALQGGMVTGREILAALTGAPPRERALADVCPYVSDLQHEFFRRYRVYARPFWVLQGETGGHQVTFTPWQQNVLAAKGLPTRPPAIGSLPACPFDNRAIQQLQHLNRLHTLEDSVDRLRRSGSAEAAAAEQERVAREIREAELAFIVQQVTPVVELAGHVRTATAFEDQVQYTAPGTATRAADALAEYRETGVFPL